MLIINNFISDNKQFSNDICRNDVAKSIDLENILRDFANKSQESVFLKEQCISHISVIAILSIKKNITFK